MFKAIGRGLRFFWNGLTVLRRILANVLLLLLLILLVAWLLRDGKELPEGAALVFAPTGDIVEQFAQPLSTSPFLDDGISEEMVLKDIIDTIDHAAADENIAMMVLDLRRMGSAGLGKLQDIGAALKRFKQNGKTVIASGTYFSQHQYYLAAHADRIYLHPMGQVWLSGYGAYRPYLKSALENLRVRLHVFRVGKYKSALEPLMRDSMSDADREATTDWLAVLWNAYKADVGTLRGIDPAALDDLIRNLDVYLKQEDGNAARLAVAFGLVDDLKTPDEVRDELIRLVGRAEGGAGRETPYKRIDFSDYREFIQSQSAAESPARGRVGLIFARGIIMDGAQPAGRIGAESISRLIREARTSEKIKALVVRIDSGGGSAVASEIIRRELELTRVAGKPVVVSMSTLAASGGYWMSVAADEIWAYPTSLTGSIGIFAALPTVDKSLDAIGIHTDGVGTTPLSNAFDPTRPLNPLLADVLQQNIENGYRQFIQQVAADRNLDPQRVDAVARGRVWAGQTAHDLGLVDRLGGLKDAIAAAARLAGLEKAETRTIEPPLSPRQRLLRLIKRFVRAWMPSFLPQHPLWRSTDLILPVFLKEGEVEAILQIKDPQHTYALCLPCLALKP
jgi:protease-4